MKYLGQIRVVPQTSEQDSFNEIVGYLEDCFDHIKDKTGFVCECIDKPEFDNDEYKFDFYRVTE